MAFEIPLPVTWYTAEEDPEAQETREWLEALEDVVETHGPERAEFLIKRLIGAAYRHGLDFPFVASTPYVNSIPLSEQPDYPGDRDLERRIKSLIRWNAMAMVVRANKKVDGIGGHISTFASSATLYQVGMNHFFRGRGEGGFAGDSVYFQGHGSPGIYAQAYLEGRIGVEKLHNFRRELEAGGGLASYPHPWLMPDFWEYPTVSMGLGPISAIYQARFNRYLADRGIVDTAGRKVWFFMGDGESDEPESLGAITLASRQKLDNLIFVINCNLQRLDGPVRGNGKIIQELETIFRGAGWNVLKVIWGDDWDPLLAADDSGLLRRRMNEVVDGQYQKYTVESGGYIREDFFGKYPQVLKLVEHLSDENLQKLRRGGHDPAKVYAAFKAAAEHQGQPTVILAKTIKGYGLGEAGEGRNVTHQQKKLNEDELRNFRDRFDIPIPDDQLGEAPFYKPPEDSEEIQYLKERRAALGGPIPVRKVYAQGMPQPPKSIYDDFINGIDRPVSTTMAFVQVLSKLLKDQEIGDRIVPIVPDEARTFGMESLFRQSGIYSSVGQVYEPVDAKMLLYYKEAKDGQILEEGITEAGSMASFTAAGTAYATHGVDMIPFFIFYSMFGFQRIGDSIWAFADMRGRGFLLGATSGRTTLNGEGLQHEDGHSHILATTVPNLLAYDPAYAYELAVIIQDGLKRMYEDREDIFYYITLCNENYEMPAMPEGSREGILKGLYRLREAPEGSGDRPRAQLFGSGPLLNTALEAQQILSESYGVAADVWSATSYKELRREALEAERWNMLHPGETPRSPYVTQLLENAPGPVIAVSDYMKLVPDQIARWVPNGIFPLGTDGFGRSETREALRRFFEVDAAHVVVGTLSCLARKGEIDPAVAGKAIADFGIDPDRPDPIRS
ncbi:MAG: pyruvate dehydrogenase (acetyl-transferring), homodimeric type [Acidobacteriota bacterium]